MDSSTKSTFPFQFLLSVIGNIGGLLLFAILIPQNITTLMALGLPTMSTIIVLLVIPVLFVSLWSIYASPRIRVRIGLISNYFAGTLSFLVGLFWEFGFDENSELMMGVIAFFLYCAFFASASMFQILWRDQKSVKERNIISLGIGILLIIISIIHLFFNSNAVLQYLIGIIYLIVPIAWTKETIPVFASRTSLTRDQKYIPRLEIFGVLLELFFVWLLWDYGIFVQKIAFGWGLLGCAVGFVLYYRTEAGYGKLLNLYLGIGILILFSIILVNNSWSKTPFFAFGTGILLGIAVGEIYRIGTRFSVDRRIGFYGWQFWGVVICAMSAACAVEFPSLLRRFYAFYWVGYLLIIIVMGISVISAKTAKLIEKKSFSSSKLPTFERFSFGSHIQKKIVLISIGLMVIAPIFLVNVSSSSNLYVQISFDEIYYTVDGEIVSELVVPARSAKILLRSMNPEGYSHSEKIRMNKSVRLGAYFYGLDGMSVPDAISWIGQNLDVFSLSMCGTANTTFTPADILAIKNLNPLVKFYYMAFATTLFEDFAIDSFHTNKTWGNSHYPTMKFNETMNSWTLKLKNGTEALGIRREQNNDSAHLMDLGQMAWADYFGWIYGDRATAYHADGIACDEVMWRGYWDTKINELANYSSLEEIIDTCYAWIERVDQRLGEQGQEFITQAFWDQAQLYQDGVWGETAFMSSREQYGDRVDDRNKTVWYEAMNWTDIVADLYNQGIRNRSYIWAAFYDRYNSESLEYAIATYLMAKPNQCLSLGFHPQPVYDGGYPANLAGYSIKTIEEELISNSKYFDLELGDAKGLMELKFSNGNPYYQREFANGIVIVNPFHAQLAGFN